ncbi:MAG: pyruvate kinase [Candidatus Eremiobacteraeota bacterium]|nr:pyruvate kinase [Candidatus Eremiobacteraeota bacterium]
MKRTKIVCTIGPVSQGPGKLRDMIKAGMDVARLNFSHGTHEWHGKIIRRIRSAGKRLRKPLAIIQDLSGPKIRLGDFSPRRIRLKEGQILILTSESIFGNQQRISVSYPGLGKDVKPGDRILLADALVELRVEKVKDPDVYCRVMNGGEIRPHKGVNLPGVELGIPAFTEKDYLDLAFGIKHGVDLIAQSFVRSADDVRQVKKAIDDMGGDQPVIAKLEKFEVLENLNEILEVADGIMVARGDLGAEIPIEQVPEVQKMLISACRTLGKPVITATQMLESMTKCPRPTRAEVTDVANAILDGTDAVMLSEESASGKYPVEAVEMMTKIAVEAEQLIPYTEVWDLKPCGSALEVISHATCEMSESLQASAILAVTASGRTARMLSRFRPRAPILAFTDSEESQRRMMLSWGVFPILTKKSRKTISLLEDMTEKALEWGLSVDDLVLITAGFPVEMGGSTDTVKLQVLGKITLRGSGAGPARIVKGKIWTGKGEPPSEGGILLLDRFKSEHIPLLKKSVGVITEYGHAGSYTAYILRKNKIPSVLGVAGSLDLLKPGQALTLDSGRGLVSVE